MNLTDKTNSVIRLKRKKRYKPLYKKFNQIFENPQSREKIFKFKKKKWENLQNHLKKESSYKNQEYSIISNDRIESLAFFSPKKYMKRHKDLLHSAKKLNLYYGGLKRKYMKNVLSKIDKKRNDVILKKLNFLKNLNDLGNLNFFFIDFMERRLEAVLHRSLFIKNINTARQLITYGYVYVNKQLVKKGSCIIKNNDIVEVDLKLHRFVLNNIKNAKYWPVPLKNLSINYKTLQILYTGFPYTDHIKNLYHFNLDIHNVTNYYTYN